MHACHGVARAFPADGALRRHCDAGGAVGEHLKSTVPLADVLDFDHRRVLMQQVTGMGDIQEGVPSCWSGIRTTC